MADTGVYPLLVLPAAAQVVPGAKAKVRGGGSKKPNKARQIQRLALAVTLEMDSALSVPLYEEIAQRLRVRAPVPVRVGR